MNSSDQLMNDMVDSFPVLAPLKAEHLEDQEGELLPYLLFGDVVRWAEREAMSNTALVSALVQWLEARFTQADADVENLIAVGFVEMIPATPEGDPILNLLGPSLREVATEMNLFERWAVPDS